MSAVLQVPATARDAPRADAAQPRIALLGTGTVGCAVIERIDALRARGIAVPDVGWIGNSRGLLACREFAVRGPAAALVQVRALAAARVPDVQGDSGYADGDPLAHLRHGDIAVDATASDAVAALHAHWLARGVHVVTANKLGSGSCAARADAIAAAVRATGTRYGDAATVGAGLPLLATIRALRAGGDRIHAVEGVLSGSLAWLFDHYDGMRPFSGFVRQARDAGYTEPDPRIDLSGEDVRRKLLILARAAGVAIDGSDVQVSSLVPATLAALEGVALDAALPVLDAPLRARFQSAYRSGARLRFVGRLCVDADGQATATVGLRALAAYHPLCGGSGTDNRVAIHSDRYPAQPLVIQGPGAGAAVTAAALVDDVIASSATRRH